MLKMAGNNLTQGYIISKEFWGSILNVKICLGPSDKIGYFLNLLMDGNVLTGEKSMKTTLKQI